MQAEANFIYKHRGTCSCGWAGQKRDSGLTAGSEAQAHWDEVHGSKAKIGVELVKVPLPRS